MPGSWKIIAILRPRQARIASSERSGSETPSKRMSPVRSFDSSGKRRMIADAVRLFPQPLSPTSAKVSPSRTAKLTSESASRGPFAEGRASFTCERERRIFSWLIALLLSPRKHLLFFVLFFLFSQLFSLFCLLRPLLDRTHHVPQRPGGSRKAQAST